MPFLKIWARIEPLRGRAYYEQYKEKTEDLSKITIRYRNNINNSMVVQYKNKLYRINTVIDPYEAHIKLELMCSIKEQVKMMGKFTIEDFIGRLNEVQKLLPDEAEKVMQTGTNKMKKP